MDWSSVGVQAITAITPVATLVLLWAVKLAWEKIPASIVLFAAPVVGLLLNFGISYISGHPASDPVLAAALGALAVFLRELATTLGTKGMTGSVSVTKGMF
jgi:hypothetical protein